MSYITLFYYQLNHNFHIAFSLSPKYNFPVLSRRLQESRQTSVNSPWCFPADRPNWFDFHCFHKWPPSTHHHHFFLIPELYFLLSHSTSASNKELIRKEEPHYLFSKIRSTHSLFGRSQPCIINRYKHVLLLGYKHLLSSDWS